MSDVILDPSDPSQAFIGSASVGPFGMAADAVLIGRVHPLDACAGSPCVIHAPSDHHMRGWPLNWRDDTGVMERLCPHGIGHPDPDHMAHARAVGNEWQAVHGCDRCCAP